MGNLFTTVSPAEELAIKALKNGSLQEFLTIGETMSIRRSFSFMTRLEYLIYFYTQGRISDAMLEASNMGKIPYDRVPIKERVEFYKYASTIFEVAWVECQVNGVCIEHYSAERCADLALIYSNCLIRDAETVGDKAHYIYSRIQLYRRFEYDKEIIKQDLADIFLLTGEAKHLEEFVKEIIS